MLPYLFYLLVEYGHSVMQERRISFRANRRAVVVTSTLIALLLAQRAIAQQRQSDSLASDSMAKLAPDLLRMFIAGSGSDQISVVVETDGKPLPPLLHTLSRGTADTTVTTSCRALDSEGTFAVSLSRSQLARLLKSRAVRHVSPDRPVYLAQDYATQTVGANVAWNNYGLAGVGVTVAVLDTGVYTHPDLGPKTNRLLGWKDLVNALPLPYDDNGHGTHVTGIVAGNGAASIQYRYSSALTWMAPQVDIVSVKVLDKSGSGVVSTVIAGIAWCIDHRQQYNIRVLNLSLGHPAAESFRTDPLCQACERAWKAGIMVVCAAGNLGRSVPSDPTSAPVYGTITSPGNDPDVLTVGATDTQGTPTITDDVIASYSSRGPSPIDFVLKPDIVAPGNQIESLAAPGSSLYSGYPANMVAPAEHGGSGPIQYFRLSGTSMACPVVAGAAALLLQADPSLTPDVVKARLMVSAKKSLVNDPFSYGAGYLNVPAALACRVAAPLGACSPFTYPADDGAIHITPNSGNNTLMWGENLIWGDNKAAANAIWGTAAWNTNGISNNAIWKGGSIPNSGTAAASIEAILLHGD